MPSIKLIAIRAALAVTLGAAALVSGAGAASAGAQYWNYKCDDGRACVYQKISGQVWNIEHCGITGLHDYYRYAMAHGNAFTIYYDPNYWHPNGSPTHPALFIKGLGQVLEHRPGWKHVRPHLSPPHTDSGDTLAGTVSITRHRHGGPTTDTTSNTWNSSTTP
ncbi:hypothetical protein [Nonomuraea sp. NPDC049158]|uniref:hypothetical protein n=1 Tax=Nonomuraea sp. NPDC049158 TaxID=3155649 RepID=UPI003402E853